MTQLTAAPKLNPKYAAFQRLVDVAHLAGLDAVRTMAPPTPMIVEGIEHDARGRAVRVQYAPVMDGVCGFAWVTIYPGTSSFARWLVKNRLTSVAYGGGVQVWVSLFNQSMGKKAAYADAYASVLQAAGLKAYSGSRID